MNEKQQKYAIHLDFTLTSRQSAKTPRLFFKHSWRLCALARDIQNIIFSSRRIFLLTRRADSFVNHGVDATPPLAAQFMGA